MSAKWKYFIEKLSKPVFEYRYNVQILISVDGGKNYYYCGVGRYCKTIEECGAYIKSYRDEHGEAT